MIQVFWHLFLLNKISSSSFQDWENLCCKNSFFLWTNSGPTLVNNRHNTQTYKNIKTWNQTWSFSSEFVFQSRPECPCCCWSMERTISPAAYRTWRYALLITFCKTIISHTTASKLPKYHWELPTSDLISHEVQDQSTSKNALSPNCFLSRMKQRKNAYILIRSTLTYKYSLKNHLQLKQLTMPSFKTMGDL